MVSAFLYGPNARVPAATHNSYGLMFKVCMFHDVTFVGGSSLSPFSCGPELHGSLLKTLLDRSRDASLVVESQTPDLASFRIIYANPVCSEWHPCVPHPGSTLGEAFPIFQAALAGPALLGRVDTLLAADLPVRGEPLTGAREGQICRVLLDINPLPASAPSLSRWLVTLRDITEQPPAGGKAEDIGDSLMQTKHLLLEAVERADRDPLTGLLNHRAFHKHLEMEAEAAWRSGQPLAVAMMDLDNFRFFNDGYGHSVGDDLLRQVTRALSAACRPGDTLARYGGDEFALLLPGLGAEGAVRLADRLVAGLDGVGYQPPGYDAVIPLTLSIGIAVFPDDGPGRLDTLAAADARLVRVKTGGAGRGDLTEHLRVKLPCSLASFSMLNALVTAVDAKDRYTRHHSEDVMAYSFQIAQELGLDEQAQRQTLLAALLHDVGKIGVPDHVLRKPGKLTEEEYEQIKQHPMMGSIIVGAVPGFEGVLDAIRHHHERWDGLGYPFGLRGEEIPQMARTMSVADAFSAMTTDRPYRKGMKPARAVCILQEGAGTQWDPASVAAFLSARREAERLEDWFEGA